MIERQAPQVRRRIHAAFVRRIQRYRAGGAIELPVGVVLGGGRRR